MLTTNTESVQQFLLQVMDKFPTDRRLHYNDRIGRSPALGKPPRRIVETDFSAPQVCGQALAGRCLDVLETAVTAWQAVEKRPKALRYALRATQGER